MSAQFSAKTERMIKRKKMYAKIHAIWAQLRPDLKKGSPDYKEALYMFAEAELKKSQIGSFTELTIAELSQICAVLDREQNQPRLYQSNGQQTGDVIQFPGNSQPASPNAEPATPVEHLASTGQCYAINRLFGYLGWGDKGREGFLKDKFRCPRGERLLKNQAHSCIRILLNYAAYKYWKGEGKSPVSQPMVKAAILRIKKEIGID